MSKPSKQEIADYKSHKAAGRYQEAAKVLVPYKDDPQVKQLITALKKAHETGTHPASKTKSIQRRGIPVILWIVALFIGMTFAGITGYMVGNGSDDGAVSVLPPPELSELFEDVCLSTEANITRQGCQEVFEFAWEYYKFDSVDCLDKYSTITAWTGNDLVDCIIGLTD